MKVNGKLCCLWRAVGREGEVLESAVAARRDKAAALKLLERTMKIYGRSRKIVTDGLCSYPAAMREIGVADRHEVAVGSAIAPRFRIDPFGDPRRAPRSPSRDPSCAPADGGPIIETSSCRCWSA
ncbi:MAG: DDE-type integrase/transposase/recombinase [Roseiarcus sp.]